MASSSSDRNVICLIEEKLLDPEFDYDFTHINDKGKVFKRGDCIYKRPCGWKRIALKVKGKYENDIWLGSPGYRTESSPGEWPVSYHGTSKEGATKIGENGYQEERLRSMRYGIGHYSTPDVEVAALYAPTLHVEGKRYKLVIQNRVNLQNSKIIPKESTGGGAEYYVTPSSNDLRAYGICIKQM